MVPFSNDLALFTVLKGIKTRCRNNARSNGNAVAPNCCNESLLSSETVSNYCSVIRGETRRIFISTSCARLICVGYILPPMRLCDISTEAIRASVDIRININI